LSLTASASGIRVSSSPADKWLRRINLHWTAYTKNDKSNNDFHIFIFAFFCLLCCGLLDLILCRSNPNVNLSYLQGPFYAVFRRKIIQTDRMKPQNFIISGQFYYIFITLACKKQLQNYNSFFLSLLHFIYISDEMDVVGAL